jgi:hypothetical protein
LLAGRKIRAEKIKMNPLLFIIYLIGEMINNLTKE